MNTTFITIEKYILRCVKIFEKYIIQKFVK